MSERLWQFSLHLLLVSVLVSSKVHPMSLFMTYPHWSLEKKVGRACSTTWNAVLCSTGYSAVAVAVAVALSRSTLGPVNTRWNGHRIRYRGTVVIQDLRTEHAIARGPSLYWISLRESFQVLATILEKWKFVLLITTSTVMLRHFKCRVNY
jgi:hypothetical protein